MTIELHTCEALPSELSESLVAGGTTDSFC